MKVARKYSLCAGGSSTLKERCPFRPLNRKDPAMRPTAFASRTFLFLLGVLTLFGLAARPADSACCFFTARDAPLAETAQNVFLSWDPEKKVESLALQPRFAGKPRDFAMVVVTPSLPVVDELPADFFHELAVFTTLSRRTWPVSALKDPDEVVKRPNAARVINEGTVGTLKHQTVSADKIEELYAWLKQNDYDFAGAEETFKAYVAKKWCFTFVRIDPAQLARSDGLHGVNVRPLRFTFSSEQLVYPLRLDQVSVRDYLDVVFYIQAPYKVDLPGELSYQYQWVALLLNSQGAYPKEAFGGELPGQASKWLQAIKDEAPALVNRGQALGFGFTNSTRPQANKLGRSATTLEWARRLTAADIKVLKGEAPFGDIVPDPDEGFTEADVKDARRKEAIFKVIQRRQERLAKDRPGGYLVRTAAAADIKNLKGLLPYLQEGQFVTKIHKTFTLDEMTEDLVLGPAKVGQVADTSEYTERLSVSPP